jgi:predicted transcriptional regulator
MPRKSETLPTVRVPPALKASLEAAAETIGEPVSWIVRQAVNDWLERFEQAPAEMIERARRSG